MSITRGNASSGSDYSGGITTTLASAAAVLVTGQANVVGVRYYDTANVITVVSVSDTAGNSYTRAQGQHFPVVDGADIEQWYCLNCVGHAANVVTVTVSVAAQYWGVVTQAYGGVATTGALDALAAGTASATTTVTSSTFSTAQADEVLVAVSDYDSATGQTWSAGSGYAIQVQDASLVLMLQDQIVNATQSSVTASASLSASRNMNLLLLSLKAVGGGGSTPSRLLLLGVR